MRSANVKSGVKHAHTLDAAVVHKPQGIGDPQDGSDDDDDVKDRLAFGIQRDVRVDQPEKSADDDEGEDEDEDVGKWMHGRNGMWKEG